MPSFLTQCPHCLTSFRVTESQLEAAEGLVRCGACLGIFSAAANRITLKQTPEEALAAQDGDETDFEESAAEIPAMDDAATEDLRQDATALNAEPAAERYDTPAPVPTQDETRVVEEAPPQSTTTPSATTSSTDVPDAQEDADLLEGDIDIPLGDFDLESDVEATDGDEDDYEDDDEDTDEVEEYEDEEEEFTPPPPRRAPVERITTDKTELREYLATIEDDEALEPLDDEALDAVDEPVTLMETPRRGWLAGVALFSANLLLLGLLALQYINANLDTLRTNARLAPAMPYLCRVLNCPVVERSQLASLVSEQVIVRSHPRYAQALEVNLVFRNDAPQAQPFPALELSFRDTANRLLANRLFTPAEYLPNELQTSEMPPGSSFQATLEMADPGSEAVNYTLAFRAP